MNEIILLIRHVWIEYLRHVVDILLCAYIIYKLMNLLKGTRSVQVLKGIVLLIIATILSEFMELTVIGWLLRWFWVAGAVALVIVFQPEIRRFLAYLGSGRLTRIILQGKVEFIEAIVRSMEEISKKGYGALIVLEQETGLREFIETGITVNSEVSSELLVTIFTPHTPLHDGAVILSAERLVAAGCLLPLTHNPSMSKVIGTRHRAAVGLSEVSDAIICVVSEETGEFSMAYEGSLKKSLALQDIKEILLNYYREKVVEKTAKIERQQ